MSDLELVRGSNGTGEAVRATVVGVRPIGSTILSVDSVMAWPNRFIATSATLGGDGVTPDPASVRVFVGKINGSNIEIESFVPGYTDTGNSVGDIIVLKQTTAWADNLADILDDFNVQDSVLTNTFDEMFGDGVVSGMAITYPATGRVADISAGVAYIGAKRVTIANTSHTFPATRDSYIMLKDDGTLTYPDVAVGGAAPVPPAGSIIIGKLTTDATKFTALQNINRGVVKAQNVDYATFPVIDGSFTPSGAGDWRNIAVIDLSQYPSGSRIEITVTARTNAADTSTLGLRLSDTTVKNTLHSTTVANEFATLINERVVTKTSDSISIQLLGMWTTENAGWYTVKRIG